MIFTGTETMEIPVHYLCCQIRYEIMKRVQADIMSHLQRHLTKINFGGM